MNTRKSFKNIYQQHVKTCNSRQFTQFICQIIFETQNNDLRNDVFLLGRSSLAVSVTFFQVKRKLNQKMKPEINFLIPGEKEKIPKI